MALQDKLDAFKAQLEGKKAPPEVVAIMRKATNDLIASGQADRALKVGDRAPEFALHDPDGWTHRSTNLLTQGPLVVTFYRGVWCPYCNLDLQALEAAANSIRSQGAGLIGHTPQGSALRPRASTFCISRSAALRQANCCPRLWLDQFDHHRTSRRFHHNCARNHAFWRLLEP